MQRALSVIDHLVAKTDKILHKLVHKQSEWEAIMKAVAADVLSMVSCRWQDCSGCSINSLQFFCWTDLFFHDVGFCMSHNIVPGRQHLT